jgi:hypothetical protein
MKHFAIKRADGGVSIMHFKGREVTDEETGAVSVVYPDPKPWLPGWEATADPSWLPIVSFEEIAPEDLPK